MREIFSLDTINLQPPYTNAFTLSAIRQQSISDIESIIAKYCDSNVLGEIQPNRCVNICASVWCQGLVPLGFVELQLLMYTLANIGMEFPV